MRLLVPVDGSAASHRALDHAVWLALGRPDARLLLVNVQNRETLGISDINAETTNEAEIAEHRSARILREAAEVCEKAGIPCETHAEFGPVVETILQIARHAQADQIVMGSRGFGRLRGALLGSVASQVIYAAEIPVTVVKKGTRLPAHLGAMPASGARDYKRPQ